MFKRAQGFTLIELMTVIAVIGLLAAIAMLSYRHFTDKAKAVEAEVALAEVDRLEQLYYANHGSYSNDLNAIGFSLASALKFYRIEVRVQGGGNTFQAMALPLARIGTPQIGLVLNHVSGGTSTMTRGDPVALAAQAGGGSDTGGSSAIVPTGAGGTPAGTGVGQTKPGFHGGGDATLAADGLLDMNFCLK